MQQQEPLAETSSVLWETFTSRRHGFSDVVIRMQSCRWLLLKERPTRLVCRFCAYMLTPHITLKAVSHRRNYGCHVSRVECVAVAIRPPEAEHAACMFTKTKVTASTAHPRILSICYNNRYLAFSRSQGVE